LSAAWSGGVKALAGAVINVLPEEIKIPASKMVPTARTFKSGPWLFPKPTIFKGDPVLIETPEKKYKVSQYKEFFDDIGQPKLFETYQRVSKLNDLDKPPGVPMHCFYGSFLPTPKKYTFDKHFSLNTDMSNWVPKITPGDGDGTVNLESSIVCHEWTKLYKEFKGVEHTDIVKNEQVFGFIKDIVEPKSGLTFLKRAMKTLSNAFDNIKC